jgi:HAMP domain-containing protein
MGVRVTEQRREITVAGPQGARVVVGMGTKDARRSLAGLLSTIVALGAATLLFSLAGGWFLVGRLLRPIRRMTASAERISDSNLAERIDVGRTETELGRLAETLNGAFNRIAGAFERHVREGHLPRRDVKEDDEASHHEANRIPLGQEPANHQTVEGTLNRTEVQKQGNEHPGGRVM